MKTSSLMMLILSLLLSLFLAVTPATAAKNKKAPKPDPAEAGLPKVLLIGDSISIGYTPHVKAELKGIAVVHHHKGNAQHTGTGLKMLDKWIGDEKWDVIHFNWGLWDLCYRHPKSKVQGKRDKVNGKITTPLKDYEKNLDQLVVRLKKTGAKLIWAHTTMVPDKEAGRVLNDDKKYNAAAARVMKKHVIPINDLNKLTRSFLPKLFTAPGNVHFKTEGSKKIAKQVADAIRAAMKTDVKKNSSLDSAKKKENPKRQ